MLYHTIPYHTRRRLGWASQALAGLTAAGRPCPWTMRMWVLVGTRFSSDTIMAALPMDNKQDASLGCLAGRSAVPSMCFTACHACALWHGLWPKPNGSSCCCWMPVHSNQDASQSFFQLWPCAVGCASVFSTCRHCSSSLTGASTLHGIVSGSFQRPDQVLACPAVRSYSSSNWDSWSSVVLCCESCG